MGNKIVLEGWRREKGLAPVCLLSVPATAALHPGNSSWLHLIAPFRTLRISFIVTLEMYLKQLFGIFSEE